MSAAHLLFFYIEFLLPLLLKTLFYPHLEPDTSLDFLIWFPRFWTVCNFPPPPSSARVFLSVCPVQTMFFTSFLTLQDESWEIDCPFLFISSLSALPVTLPWGRCVVVVTITYKLDLQTLPDLTDLWSVSCGLLSGPQTGSHSHKQTKHNKVKYYKWGHIIYHTHACKMFTVHSFLCVGQKKQKQTQETDVNILFNLYEFTFTLESYSSVLASAPACFTSWKTQKCDEWNTALLSTWRSRNASRH